MWEAGVDREGTRRGRLVSIGREQGGEKSRCGRMVSRGIEVWKDGVDRGGGGGGQGEGGWCRSREIEVWEAGVDREGNKAGRMVSIGREQGGVDRVGSRWCGGGVDQEGTRFERTVSIEMDQGV